MERILVAMSGGVDSTGVLYKFRKNGISADGVMMLVAGYDESAVTDAKKACEKLGANLHILDLQKEFEECVIGDFISEYRACRTPNPCIVCNQKMKFGLLADFAKENGYDALATGHYAKTEKSGDRVLLKKADDRKKDQSYVLYGIKKELLPYLRFPLSANNKAEIRAELEENGFENSKRKDSQDICFVQNGKYAEFIENYTNEKFLPGEFCTADGKVLGMHKGLIRYTIGQRKGLGLALPQPMYVQRLDKENNQVILSLEPELFTKRVEADKINLIAVDKICDGMKVMAKTRYAMAEQPARVFETENGFLVEFEEAQRAITPGQAVVLYDGDVVVGGGRII